MTATRESRLTEALLLLATILTALGLSVCAILRYQQGRSDWAFDLAFFHSLLASAARGEGFRQTVNTPEQAGILHLTHAYFVLGAYVPFYRLVPRLETLLALQSAVLASGALPLFGLARLRGVSSGVALGLAALYLTAPSLWLGAMADFRPLLLAAPLLLWTAWGLATGRLAPALVWALLACSVREEVPLMVGALAAVFLARRLTPHRVGLSVALFSLAWFVMLFLIRSRMSFYIPFHDPIQLMSSLLDFFRGMGTADGPSFLPQKLYHLGTFLFPAFWTAFLEPLVLLGASPLLVYQVALSPDEWWHWGGAYVHHCMPLLAFTSAAGVLGWVRLLTPHAEKAAAPTRRWLLRALLALSLLAQSGATVQGMFTRLEYTDPAPVRRHRLERARSARSLIDRIPPEASAATDYDWIALLSGRPVLVCTQHPFRLEGEREDENDRRPALRDVDWVLLSTDATGFSDLPRLQAALEAQSDWMLVAQAGPHRLYRQVRVP